MQEEVGGLDGAGVEGGTVAEEGTRGSSLTADPVEGFLTLDMVTGRGAKSLSETVSSRPPEYLILALEGLTETRSTSSHNGSYLDLRTCLLASTLF